LASKLGEGGTATENSSGAAAVRLEHVTKQYKSMMAVDDLSLELAPGEFFALLGPSGCGKTTTLRMVGGFDQPTSGKIFLGGDDITWTPPYKRDVNTVFQSYALFPHLSVFDNVAFGLRRKGTDKREISQLVEERDTTFWWSAATRRTGARPRQSAEGAAVGRAHGSVGRQDS